MSWPKHQWSISSTLLLISSILLFISFSSPIRANLTEKLDQTLVPQEADTQIKCGTCPCMNPCTQQQPPPLPPPPPPPTNHCTNPLPPPPPRFIYVTGGPGEEYDTDTTKSWFYAGAKKNADLTWPLLVSTGLLQLILLFRGTHTV